MKAESSGTTGQGKPTTADVQESLVNAANFKDFLLRNAQNMLAQTLPEYLSLQLKQKHLRRADVVRDRILTAPMSIRYSPGRRPHPVTNCWRLPSVYIFLTRKHRKC